MNMDLAEVKACLRALLSSSAFSYTLNSLLHDFRKTTGFDLPLFGCRNPVEFLMSLTDTIQLIGDLSNPIVALIQSDKSSHITSLVDRQRNKKCDTSYRCLPPRLILSIVKDQTNNFRGPHNEVSYPPQNQKYYPPQRVDQIQRNYNTENYGKQNLYMAYEDQRKICKNPVPALTNNATYDPLCVSINFRNDQQNRIVSTVNQPKPNLESQHVPKDFPSSLSTIVEPLPPSCQSDNMSSSPKAPQNTLEETEKTDSCYFADFSDIDSVCNDNEKSSPRGKTNSTPPIYINDRVKIKLRNLIKKFPDGLWCCDLPDSFHREYNDALDYREFGCTSLIEMLSELSDVFRCIRPGKEDWILFDASVPPSDKEKTMMKLQENGHITSNIANNLRDLLLERSEHSDNGGIELTRISKLYQAKFNTPLDFQSLGFPTLKSLLETYEGSLLNIHEVDKKLVVLPVGEKASVKPIPWKEALPPITKDNDIFKDIFPSDVVGPEGKYPQLDLSLHVAVGQRIEVSVAEVWSPGEFCIQLNKFRDRWSRFATDLQEFYHAHLNKYKMPDSTIIPQQVCVGLYSEDSQNPDEWNRARILKVINERTVMIEFVDFGTVARVRKTQLRFLHRSFQSLPIQAFAAALYNLAPANGDMWSMKASKKFLDLSRVSYLDAEVVEIDFKKPLLKVVLYDPSYKPCLNINKELISENLAKLVDIKKERFNTEPIEQEVPKTETSKKDDGRNDGSFGMVSDEFSDVSDLELDHNTALYHFKMRSRKADEGKKYSESEEKQKAEKVVDEFEVPDWDKVEEPEPKVVAEKEKPKKSDLFIGKENIPLLKEKPVGENSPKASVPQMITKGPPPGLEHLAELNEIRIMSFEHTDEVKKKINILTVELLTTNPSLKQVAVQDPSLALKIASDMAEVFARWLYCDINTFRTDTYPARIMPEPSFMVPLPPPLPPFIAPGDIQMKKELEPTSFTNELLVATKLKPTPSPKTSPKPCKYIHMETIGGKTIHVTTINGHVYFFAEELIRTFSQFTNRDVADRVLNLKKVVVEYKIVNKSSARNLLTEVKSCDIPGVFKKKSKKWNVYLIAADTVIKYLQGLGCETQVLRNDVVRIEKLQAS